MNLITSSWYVFPINNDTFQIQLVLKNSLSGRLGGDCNLCQRGSDRGRREVMGDVVVCVFVQWCCSYNGCPWFAAQDSGSLVFLCCQLWFNGHF